MALPVVYRRYPESSITTYDWTDMNSGLGYVTYYAHATTLSGTNISYHLSENTMYSKPSWSGSTVTTTTTSYQDLATWTFDTSPFNLPRIIQGTAFVEYSSIDNGNGDHQFKVTLAKYDGATETTLGSVWAPAEIISPATETIPIDIAKTKFAVGDKLRLKMNIWGISSAGSNLSGALFFDPYNADALGVTATSNHTNLKVEIPYWIDL